MINIDKFKRYVKQKENEILIKRNKLSYLMLVDD